MVPQPLCQGLHLFRVRILSNDGAFFCHFPNLVHQTSFWIWFSFQAIETATPDRNLQKRTKNIETTFLESLYRNVCRSLFEKDKMLFSLLLCVRIKQFHGHMDGAEWRFLLAGGMLMSEDVLPPNPSGPTGWLDPAAWEQLFLLSKLHALDGLYQDVVAHTDAWREYFDHQVNLSLSVGNCVFAKWFIEHLISCMEFWLDSAKNLTH